MFRVPWSFIYARIYENNFASAPTCRIILYVLHSFAVLTPSISPRMYKAFLCSHLVYAIRASPPFSPGIPRRLEMFKNLQELRHGLYESHLHGLYFFGLACRIFLSELIGMSKMVHDLLDFPLGAALGNAVILLRFTNRGVTPDVVYMLPAS